MAELGVTLHVVELVLGQALFEVTDARNPLHIQLRTDTEFFQKENLVNIGVVNLTKRFPAWRYVAWIDGDITFFNPTAITDTLYRLQRHPVVQMWSKACDLGPDGMPMDLKGPDGSQSAIVSSFAYCYANRVDRGVATYWHPGYAWAMRRETFEAVGGLYENARDAVAGGVVAIGVDPSVRWSNSIQRMQPDGLPSRAVLASTLAVVASR
jgi:hypothetical protein